MRSATREAFGDFTAERMRSNASGRDVRLLAQREFEHVKGEEGAFQTGGTQGDAELREHPGAPEAFAVGDRHALHHGLHHRDGPPTDRTTLAPDLASPTQV